MTVSRYALDILAIANRLMELDAAEQAREVIKDARESITLRLSILDHASDVARTRGERISVTRRRNRELDDDIALESWLTNKMSTPQTATGESHE